MNGMYPPGVQHGSPRMRREQFGSSVHSTKHTDASASNQEPYGSPKAAQVRLMSGGNYPAGVSAPSMRIPSQPNGNESKSESESLYSPHEQFENIASTTRVFAKLKSAGLFKSLSGRSSFQVTNKCSFAVRVICCSDPNYTVVMSRSGKLGIGAKSGGAWFEIAGSQQNQHTANNLPVSWMSLPAGQSTNINATTKETYVTLTDLNKTCLGVKDLPIRMNQCMEVLPF